MRKELRLLVAAAQEHRSVLELPAAQVLSYLRQAWQVLSQYNCLVSVTQVITGNCIFNTSTQNNSTRNNMMVGPPVAGVSQA